MPLTRQQKEERVAKTQADLVAATSVVFVAYSGLTVADVNQLRESLHAAGGGMRIVPKRLLQRVLAELKWDFDPLAEAGQLATVWGADPVAPAKVMNDFRKEHEEKVRLLAGVLEGNVLSLEQVTALAQLPSRDELRARLVGTLAGPARGLVSVLSAVPRSVVLALSAIAEKK